MTERVNLWFHHTMQSVRVDEVYIGPGHPLVLISGPCVVEDDQTMDRAGHGLKEICRELGLPWIFKSSYEKDNRGHGQAYRGPGLDAGLALLGRLRRDLGVPVTTDVHRAADIPAAASVIDLIQIPALLCRQTSLLEAAGRSGRPVNVKKGQFMSPPSMAGAVSKVREAGGSGVLLTERGTCFGYDRLVCDLAGLPALRALGCPVLLDAGHAADQRELIPVLARAGVAAGVDGLFLECHPDPARARCDGHRMLSLDELRSLMREIVPLARLTRETSTLKLG